jgi:hypothetical protein
MIALKKAKKWKRRSKISRQNGSKKKNEVPANVAVKVS